MTCRRCGRDRRCEARYLCDVPAVHGSALETGETLGRRGRPASTRDWEGLMARRRYCGMCDAWVSRLTCPVCGADTDAPRQPSESRRLTLDVGSVQVPVTVTRASRSPLDGAERGWRVYTTGRRWIAHGVTAQDALARARAVLLSRQRPAGFL